MKYKSPPATIPGLLYKSDIEAIATLAQNVPDNGIVVESGALYGCSSWIWSNNVPPTAKVICIDPWIHVPWMNDIRDQYNANDLSIDEFNYNVRDCVNIETIHGYSPECVSEWNTFVDVYFDDANHTNPVLLQNLDFWSRWIKPGGIISGHDFSINHPDVVYEATAISHRWQTCITVRGSVWWVKRPFNI